MVLLPRSQYVQGTATPGDPWATHHIQLFDGTMEAKRDDSHSPPTICINTTKTAPVVTIRLNKSTHVQTKGSVKLSTDKYPEFNTFASTIEPNANPSILSHELNKVKMEVGSGSWVRFNILPGPKDGSVNVVTEGHRAAIECPRVVNIKLRRNIEASDIELIGQMARVSLYPVSITFYPEFPVAVEVVYSDTPQIAQTPDSSQN